MIPRIPAPPPQEPIRLEAKPAGVAPASALVLVALGLTVSLVEVLLSLAEKILGLIFG